MKRSQTITFGQEARQRLLHGVAKLAKAAAVTFGPRGRIVILERVAGTVATKDGATVVREVTFSDPAENLGAALLKEPGLAISEKVVDGTTSVAMLTNSLLQE